MRRSRTRYHSSANGSFVGGYVPRSKCPIQPTAGERVRDAYSAILNGALERPSDWQHDNRSRMDDDVPHHSLLRGRVPGPGP